MVQRAIVSVPGKLILMGEHAAVYGRPALVVAASPRARVEVRIRDRVVVVDLPDFGQRAETTWSRILAHAAAARETWQRYAESPTPERFAALRSDSPAHLVTLAMGEVAGELAAAELPAVSVRVESGLPVGSGFGSSAATAVAVISGMLCLFEGSMDLDRVDRLALEVERRQHGLPSGVDHKTVLHGGVVWAERSAGRSLTVAPLPVRSGLLSRLQVFQTGRPKETTGEVVAAVKRRREEQPGSFDALLDRMQANVHGLRDQLGREAELPSRVNDLLQDYERCLEQLGVVPSPVRETIREIEAAGGASKISGAGALTGGAAGCLLVHWPAEAHPGRARRLTEYRRQTVELGTDGLRLEVLE